MLSGPDIDTGQHGLGPYIPMSRGEHYTLLKYTLELKPAGTAIEFGVGSGQSTRLIADRMPVIGFDSGLGLPEDWRPPEFPKGSFACGMPDVPNATLIEGWFADTLPEFDFSTVDIGLVHIDCDLYSSTKTALRYIGPHLKPGAFLVFDEAHGYPEWEQHEWRAWHEYAEQACLSWEVIGHSYEQWSIRLA